MKMKKFFAVLLVFITCLMCMPLTSFAAKKKGITLDKTYVSIEVGETCTLKATLSGISKTTLQWSSSDKSVATIKKGGIVTAKGIGTATITVKVKGTDYKARCKVWVTGDRMIPSDLTGAELVSKIKVGVNLGCYLDGDCTWFEDEMNHEAWVDHVKINEEFFTTYKKAGFNAVRIPVTWEPHLDEKGNISKQWLDKVQEFVDYAYDNGMYVILNSHQDEYLWLKIKKYDSIVARRYKKLWTQIAERFKDYDERLIFESMNEPRTIGSENEWVGGTAAERKVLTKYNQLFVDTIRASSGNNKNRCLIIPGYAANWSMEALNDIKIPNNDNKVIASVHIYEPYSFVSTESGEYNTDVFTKEHMAQIDSILENINECLVSKGIPVIIDEFGSDDKNNASERAKHAKYLVSEAGKLGIPCMWWDDGYVDSNCTIGLMDRKTYEWYFPELTKAIIDAVK